MFYKRRLNSSRLQCIYTYFTELPYTNITSLSHYSRIRALYGYHNQVSKGKCCGLLAPPSLFLFVG